MKKDKPVRSDHKDFEELFIQHSGDSPTYSALWFSRNGDMGMHFFGYAETSKVLAGYITKTGGDNALVYPLIFLIRHSIELGLKETIARSYKLDNLTGSIPGKVWKTHDLSYLVNTAEAHLKDYKIESYDDWNLLKIFLVKWQNADPTGSFGRYSRSNGGVPYNVKGNVYAGKVLISGLKAIDTLEGLLSMLEEYIHTQNEINSEMSGNY
ncbi:MAG: hypothetical protein ACYDBI_06515 [Thermoplasmataceae archaeon]